MQHLKNSIKKMCVHKNSCFPFIEIGRLCLQKFTIKNAVHVCRFFMRIISPIVMLNEAKLILESQLILIVLNCHEIFSSFYNDFIFSTLTLLILYVIWDQFPGTN